MKKGIKALAVLLLISIISFTFVACESADKKSRLALENTISLIEKLPDSVESWTGITADIERDIQSALAAYNSLSDDNKALVTNYGKLTSFVSYQAEKTDRTAAAKVSSMIANLPEASNAKYNTDIDTVKKAYDKLTDKQKEYIEPEKLTKLAAVIEAVSELSKLNSLNTKINSYDELTVTLDNINSIESDLNQLTNDQRNKFENLYPGALVKIAAYKDSYYSRIESNYNANVAAINNYITAVNATITADYMVYCDTAFYNSAKALITTANTKFNLIVIWTRNDFVLKKNETTVEFEQRIREYNELTTVLLKEAKDALAANVKVLEGAERILGIYNQIISLSKEIVDPSSSAFKNKYTSLTETLKTLEKEGLFSLLVQDARDKFEVIVISYEYKDKMIKVAERIESALLAFIAKNVTVDDEARIAELQYMFDNPTDTDGMAYLDNSDILYIQSKISAAAKANLKDATTNLTKAKKAKADKEAADIVIQLITDLYNNYTTSFTGSVDKQREFLIVYSTVEVTVISVKAQYNLLTADQKALVLNYNRVTTVETAIATAKITASVQVKLAALNGLLVQLSDESQITAAYNAYLNDIKAQTQRDIISIEYQYYVTAKARIDYLKKVTNEVNALLTLIRNNLPAATTGYTSAHANYVVDAMARLTKLIEYNDPEVMDLVGAANVLLVQQLSAHKNAVENASQLLTVLVTSISKLSSTQSTLANIVTYEAAVNTVTINLNLYISLGTSPNGVDPAAATDASNIGVYNNALIKLSELKDWELEYKDFLNNDYKLLPALAAVTISDETTVNAVADKYNLLNSEQKTAIGNVVPSNLTALKNKIISLTKINEIINDAAPYSVASVAISDKAAIIAIVMKYTALTDAEKNSISTTYSKLVALQTRITVLEKELADWNIMKAFIDNVSSKLSVLTVKLDANNRDLLVEEYNNQYKNVVLALYTSYKAQWTAAGLTSDQSTMLVSIEVAKLTIDDCLIEIDVQKQTKADIAAAKTVINAIEAIISANITYESETKLIAEENRITTAFVLYNAMTAGQLTEFTKLQPTYSQLLIDLNDKAKAERVKLGLKKSADNWTSRFNNLQISSILNLDTAKINTLKSLRIEYDAAVTWNSYVSATVLAAFVKAEILIQVKICDDEIVSLLNEAKAATRAAIEVTGSLSLESRIANVTSASGSYTLLPIEYQSVTYVLNFNKLAEADSIVQSKKLMYKSVSDVEILIDSLKTVIGTPVTTNDYITHRDIIISTYNSYRAICNDTDITKNYAQYLKDGYSTYIVKTYTDLTTKETALCNTIIALINNLPAANAVQLTDQAAVVYAYDEYYKLIDALRVKITNKQKLEDVYAALFSKQTITLADFEARINAVPDAATYCTGSTYLDYEAIVTKLIADYKLLPAYIKTDLGTANADKISDLETIALPYGKLRKVADLYYNLLENSDGSTSAYFGKVDAAGNQTTHKIKLIAANAAYSQLTVAQLSQFSITFPDVVALRNTFIARNARIDEIAALAVKINNLPAVSNLNLETHASAIDTYVIAAYQLTAEEVSNDLTQVVFNTIVAAANRMDVLKNAAIALVNSLNLVSVSELVYIDSIIAMVEGFRNTYNALSDGQKALVTNYTLISTFEIELNEQMTLINNVLLAMSKLKYESGVSLVNIDPANGYAAMLNTATQLFNDLSTYKLSDSYLGLTKSQNMINRVMQSEKYYLNYLAAQAKMDLSNAKVQNFNTKHYIKLDPLDIGNKWYNYANALTYLEVLDEFNKLSADEKLVANNAKITSANTSLINNYVNTVKSLMTEVEALPSVILNFTDRALFVNVKTKYDGFYENDPTSDPDVNTRQKAINGTETYTNAQYKALFDAAMLLLTNYDNSLVVAAQNAINTISTITTFAITDLVKVTNARKAYDALPVTSRSQISTADYSILLNAEIEMTKLQSAESVKQNIIAFYARLSTLKGSDCAVITVLYNNYMALDYSIRIALMDTTLMTPKSIEDEINELKVKADQLLALDNIYNELLKYYNLKQNSKFALSDKVAYLAAKTTYEALLPADQNYLTVNNTAISPSLIITTMDTFLSSLASIEAFATDLQFEHNKLSSGIFAVTLAMEQDIKDLRTRYNGLNNALKYTLNSIMYMLTDLEDRMVQLNRIKTCNELIAALRTKYSDNLITSNNLTETSNEMAAIESLYLTIDNSKGLTLLVTDYGFMKTVEALVNKLKSLSTLKMLLADLQKDLTSEAIKDHVKINYVAYQEKIDSAKYYYGLISSDNTLLLDIQEAYKVVAAVEIRLAATKEVGVVYNMCSIIGQKFNGGTLELSDESYVKQAQTKYLELGTYVVEVINAEYIGKAIVYIDNMKQQKANEVINRTKTLYNKHTNDGLQPEDKTEFNNILKIYNVDLTDEMRTLCGAAYDQLMICQSVFNYFTRRNAVVEKVNNLYTEYNASPATAFKSVAKQTEIKSVAAEFSIVYDDPSIRAVYKPSVSTKDNLTVCTNDVAVWEKVDALIKNIDKIGTPTYDSSSASGLEKENLIILCRDMLTSLGTNSIRVPTASINTLVKAESDIKVLKFIDSVLVIATNLTYSQDLYNKLTATEKAAASSVFSAFVAMGGTL